MKKTNSEFDIHMENADKCIRTLGLRSEMIVQKPEDVVNQIFQNVGTRNWKTCKKILEILCSALNELTACEKIENDEEVEKAKKLIISVMTAYVDNYDSHKLNIIEKYRSIPRPDYILTEKKDQFILNKNLEMFRVYTDMLASEFGKWFLEIEIDDDPFDGIDFGEGKTIQELQVDNRLNRPWYPDTDKCGTASLPYGVLMFNAWDHIVGFCDIIMSETHPELYKYDEMFLEAIKNNI